jgi:putative ABC transport system substrate-binding protein
MALGLAISMARPGGNVTGFWMEGDEGLIGKRISLLKDAVPGITLVGVMVDSGSLDDGIGLKGLAAAAHALGVSYRVLQVRTAAELESAFATATREGLQGLHISHSGLFDANRAEVTALAAQEHLPAVYGLREFAEAGGLLSYTANVPDIYRRLAGFVDRILRGASPGALPIQRPTIFELVVNLKTAKLMGLVIPEPFLLLADEVIQ